MSTEIRVPTLGESVTEATIVKWLKNVGDLVVADESLVQLETDKVAIDIPAPVNGVLESILVKECETVGINRLLGFLVEEEPRKGNRNIVSDVQDLRTSASEARDQPISPAALKWSIENNVDTTSISGTGKRGQILKGDIISKIEEEKSVPEALSVPESPESISLTDSQKQIDENRIPMTPLRQTIARRLKDSQNVAATLTTFNEVDMGQVIALRHSYKDIFEKKHGVKLGFMGFFTKAVCHILKEIPIINAHIEGTDVIFKQYVNIAIAVSTEKGLVVPVIQNADQMSIAKIEHEVDHLGKKARSGKLMMSDMQGGTFTISNGGIYGSLMSTPILNAPQSGILGMHKIEERPVVRSGQITVAMMMYVALSYDHRIVDGKEAVTFLIRVKEILEDPQRLVLDL